jgi:zinc protease
MPKLATAGRRGFLQVYEAPNGMTIIVKENHSTPIVSLSAYVRGGLRAESDADQGITNFMQRLLMKGTQSRSAEQVASELEFIGATMSPFTGKDVFGATLSCLSKHFKHALEVYADCLTRARFGPDEVEKERKIILADIDKRRDDTLGYCLDLCESVLFERHPYRYPIHGRETSVRNIDVAALGAWHARFYSPQQMVLALVGDVQADHAVNMLLEAFGDFTSRSVDLPLLLPERPLHSTREISERRDKRQVAVAIGFQAPAFGTHEYFAFDVLEHVLSGMGSRLFIELRDKQGLGYVVNCSYDARLDMGSFRIYIGTSEDRRERARVAMLEELKKLTEQKVGREELSRTRQYMLGLYEIALQRNGAQASRLAYYHIMGAGYQLLDEYPRAIKKVTSQNVLEVARTYLDVDHYALAQVMA